MKLTSFLGSSFLIAVTYIDPGNYSTDIAGGVAFQYKLLFVILLSSILSLGLQNLSAKLGIVTGNCLASNCRLFFPTWLSRGLWFFSEIAIVATDLTEVLGSAIALRLLFGIPVVFGVILTSLDTFFILLFFRESTVVYFEWLTGIFVVAVGICFTVLLGKSQPPAVPVLLGFLPSTMTTSEIVIGLGILGATVMPHSLFLHSFLVLESDHKQTCTSSRVSASFWATNLALFFAFYINCSILIVSGSSLFGSELPDLQSAYAVLGVNLGKVAASTFALALLLSGQTSSFIGTLAGQVVFEGFLKLRLSPALRHMVTRAMALIPAVAFTIAFGEAGISNLLIYSQIVLSALLPFAVIPLVVLTSKVSIMGEHVLPLSLKCLYGCICMLLVGIDLFLLYSAIHG